MNSEREVALNQVTNCSFAVKHQNSEIGIGCKLRQSNGMAPEHELGVPGRMKPNYLRWRSQCCREFVEVGICAQDDNAFPLSKRPDLPIWTRQQSKFAT